MVWHIKLQWRWEKTHLPIGKNRKKIVFFKDELGGKIMKKFLELRAKTYAYLIDDDNEKKKAKRTKKCVIKKLLQFNDQEDYLLNNKIKLKL